MTTLELLKPLVAGLSLSHPGFSNKDLERAFIAAEKAHAGQLRKSGDAYITHPVAVAQILIDLGMDLPTVMAALLHDTVEDTTYSIDQIKSEFGDEVTSLVDGVTKLDKLTYGPTAEAETLRKMVVAMSRDIRVLVIKLADRLHNARTWDFIAPETAQRKAKETIDIYAPLAHRLGMNAIKWELEDLSFKILEPKKFEEIETSFIGGRIQITGLTQTYNLATGVNQTVTAGGHYFKFSTTDVSVATVTRSGLVSIVGEGTAEITATLNGVEVSGSLSITSLGQFVVAATPTVNASNVISIFSDAYTNQPVEYYNGYWAPYQTTLGQNDITINGDNIIKYSELNFVGIQFTKPTIDVSQMTNFHVDIQVINELDSGDFVTVKLQDIGPDNTFGTGDDSAAEIKYSSSNLVAGEWVGIDIPLSSLSSLTGTSNLAQVVFVSDATVTDMYVDNIYFNK